MALEEWMTEAGVNTTWRTRTESRVGLPPLAAPSQNIGNDEQPKDRQDDPHAGLHRTVFLLHRSVFKIAP
jgi:hypothetical protein